MADEPTLSNDARMAILKQLGQKAKPVEADIPEAAKVFETKTTPVNETTPTQTNVVKAICPNCGCKIHYEKPTTETVKEQTVSTPSKAGVESEVIDLTQPGAFNKLLEKATESREAVIREDKQVEKLTDDVRQKVIERINNPRDLSVIKNWKW